MYNLSIVIPFGFQLSSVANCIDVFEEVNELGRMNKLGPFFKIQLVREQKSGNGDPELFQGYKIVSTRSKQDSNMVIVPAIQRKGLKEKLSQNANMVRWIHEQYKNGAEVASLCTGAYLLAETGILNGRLATTHVDFCADFILAYPRVFTKPGKTLTVDWNCYTSGGSTSSFHLLIYLVQKFCGNEIAVKVSKVFAVELDRFRQSYFSTFRPVYSHNDELLIKIQNRIENKYAEINTIEEVVEDFPGSRRNLLRRFVKATGITPIHYLQNVRIEKAKQMLENSDMSVAEIISKTGYTDPKSFRKVFLKLVGITPLEYREKFRIR